MEFVYIGVFLCAIAFAIVTIYIAKILLRLTTIQKSLGNTLGEVETKLQYITSELSNTIKETDKTIDDVEHKLRATDSLFDTLENVGTSINNLSRATERQEKKLASDRVMRDVRSVAHSVQWSEVAFQLFSKWKSKGRNGGEA